MMGKCHATNKFHWITLQFGCQKKESVFTERILYDYLIVLNERMKLKKKREWTTLYVNLNLLWDLSAVEIR